MTNNETLNKYFIWEENNSTEHQKNYENKNVSEINDTITNTKIDSTQIDWRSITDPKLRKKMRDKEAVVQPKVHQPLLNLSDFLIHYPDTLPDPRQKSSSTSNFFQLF